MLAVYILIGSFPRFLAVALKKVVQDGWIIDVVGIIKGLMRPSDHYQFYKNQ